MKGKKMIIAIHILLIAICLITTGISAANLIGADSVQYKDTTVKAALDDLINNTSTCQDMRLASKVKLGDYVSMTPTSTSYTISKDLTGYSSDRTINPSELNLWRVIDIHEDGTIDMVSEYVSSVYAYFYGKPGYLKFVGALNTIAKQYENSKFTIGSRHMGYNGQTETITNTSKFTTPAPWTYNTQDNSNEAVGGGDILYEKDYNLVKSALGTTAAYRVGTTSSTSYWLASRNYDYHQYTPSYWYFDGRYINGNSVRNQPMYSWDEGWDSYDPSRALRPIVTLKSGLLALGSGTSDDPWILG